MSKVFHLSQEGSVLVRGELERLGRRERDVVQTGDVPRVGFSDLRRRKGVGKPPAGERPKLRGQISGKQQSKCIFLERGDVPDLSLRLAAPDILHCPASGRPEKVIHSRLVVTGGFQGTHIRAGCMRRRKGGFRTAATLRSTRPGRTCARTGRLRGTRTVRRRRPRKRYRSGGRESYPAPSGCEMGAAGTRSTVSTP